MTLGNAAAAAQVQFIVWCWDCRHRSSPIRPKWPSDTAPRRRCRIGHERLRCSQCGSGNVDMVVSGARR
jgi:hypothetical protein